MQAMIFVAAIPMMILNLLGFIVGATWLAWIGDWRAILLGIGFMFGGTIAVSLLLAPSLLFVGALGMAGERASKPVTIALGALSLLWTYTVLIAWFVYVFWLITDRASNDSTLPYMLWAYAAATAPWSYMAQHEARTDPNAPAVMVTFYAQLGCISMMVGTLLANHSLSLQQLAVWFVPAVALALLLQIAMLFSYSQDRSDWGG